MSAEKEPAPLPAPVATASLGPPALSAAAASRPGWHIQIGAYAEEGEAKGRLAAARARVSSFNATAEAYTERTVKGSVEYIRARFAGFHDEAEARRACEVLKKNDFACIPVKN